jgi:hypothetical protein
MKRKSLALRIALALALLLTLVGTASADDPVPGVEPKTASGNLLLPGESVTVDKTVRTPAIPPKPDIYFLADSTASMGLAIANVKANAASIMGQVAAAQPDAQFGAGNYRDFPRDLYAFQNDASIGDQAPALDAIQGWSAFGGYDGSEAQLFALDQIAADAVSWRPDSTAIVVWFGDWPGHDPVCSAISGLTYDITEASVTAKLQTAGIQVIAISVHTNYPCSGDYCDLDGDPRLNASDYASDCAIGGSAGQASRIAEATGGAYFSNVSPDQVSAKLLEGLTNLPATVTPQLDSSCSTELDYAFSPGSQTVTSGDPASFVETVTVKGDATPGLKTCTVDWLINGVSAGVDFAQSIHIYVDTPPKITSFAATPDVGAVDTPGSVVAEFTDPDYDIGDTHTCEINWGDGTTVPGAITEPGATGPGTCSATHAYGAAGMYDVTVTVTDSRALSDSATTTVIAYDRDAGFVTGGGWIDSPAGAYVPDPTLTGKANFGLVSKYKKGASTPTGNTEFQFGAADLNFHSDSYEWLVVTGSDDALYRGVGTINGEDRFKFVLWARDGEPDTFRIKIWTEGESGVETVVYDNGFDQAIGSGSIVIHSRE